MILTLQRESLFPTTTGRLIVDGACHSHTLELPWRDNRRQISCIPPGAYPLTFRASAKFKRSILHLENVPGRDGILIHPANHVAELRGCIALGVRMAVNPDYLLDSRRSVDALESIVLLAMDRKERVTLEILNPVTA